MVLQEGSLNLTQILCNTKCGTAFQTMRSTAAHREIHWCSLRGEVPRGSRPIFIALILVSGLWSWPWPRRSRQGLVLCLDSMLWQYKKLITYNNKLIIIYYLYVINNKWIPKQKQSKFNLLPILSSCPTGFCSGRMPKGLDLGLGLGLEGSGLALALKVHAWPLSWGLRAWR